MDYSFGWLPDPDSDEYWSYEDRLKSRMKSISSGDVNLRPFCSPRQNQKSTSSCVAQSVVNALELKRIMKHGRDDHQNLSVLAVYYLAREMMLPKRTHRDDGTFISLGCDVLRRFGVPTEQQFPWDPRKVFMRPSWGAMREAYLHKIDSFYRIGSRGKNRVDEVIRCLQAGNPVIFGTTVGANWYEYKRKSVSGDLPGPLGLPLEAKGRHATVIVGYEDGLFIGENSWGTGWGDDGFYMMKPSVIENTVSKDFWVIQAGWEPYEED